MVQLTSSTQSVEEMTAALEAHGQSVTSEAPAPSQDNSSVPAESPSEVPGATPEGESAPASEAGNTQEAKPPAAEPTNKRGNFESRRVRLEKERDRLREDLEYERSDRAKLDERLAAAEAELAKLRPAQPATEPELVAPAAPAPPRREGDDYDGSRYEQAMQEYFNGFQKYQSDLAAYHAALTERTVKKTLTQREEERKQLEAQEAVARKQAELRAIITEQAKAYDDYQELVEAMPTEPIQTHPAFDEAIMEADNKAMLLRHFMIDYLDNNSKELNSILALDPVKMVKAIDRLEARLVAESKPKESRVPPPAPAPVAVPAAAAAPPAVERPARPKFTPPPAPIEPVGARAAGTQANLGMAKGAMEYIRLRGSGVNR